MKLKLVLITLLLCGSSRAASLQSHLSGRIDNKDEGYYNPLTSNMNPDMMRQTPMFPQQGMANQMMYPFFQNTNSVFGGYPAANMFPQAASPVMPYLLMPTYNPMMAAQGQMMGPQQLMDPQQMAEQYQRNTNNRFQEIINPEEKQRRQAAQSQASTTGVEDSKVERKKKFLENKLSEAINQLEALTEEAKHIYEKKDEIKRSDSFEKLEAYDRDAKSQESANDAETPSFLEIRKTNLPTKMETSEKEEGNLKVLNELMERLKIFETINDK